jgi:hypothetical protein
MVYCIPYIRLDGGGAPAAQAKRIWLFLDQNGTAAIETPEEDMEEFLAENGLVTKSLRRLGSGASAVVLAEIDPEATGDLDAFYAWSEVDPGAHPQKEVWRLFLWMEGDAAAWDVNEYLQGITVAPEWSAHDIVAAAAGAAATP